MIYDLAECQDVKIFSGLFLIIRDFRTFSTKFCERFSEISSDFSKIWRFLRISMDFWGFSKLKRDLLDFQDFQRISGFHFGFLT